MFKRESNESPIAAAAETIIGPSIKVKGNFNGEGSIVIEGQLEGSVKTNGYLLVGDKAKITAQVEAKDAKIGGEVNGNIKVSGYLEITATAKIAGDIEAMAISIEKGALLNGKCAMGPVHRHDEGTAQA